MDDSVVKRFRQVAPQADFVSLRGYEERSERLAVRQGVMQPIAQGRDGGVMITVVDRGGVGYAATSDVSASGLERAAAHAKAWAERVAGRAVTDFSEVKLPNPQGSYETKVSRPWQSLSLVDKVALLSRVASRLKRSEHIVDWEASLWYARAESRYVTLDGGDAHQVQHILAPDLRATANRGAETQTRTLGSLAYCRQGGLEVLDALGYEDRAERVAEESLELLAAENCPSGRMDLLLDADQMLLQIHESIGHPLELDRILGDERNYAGTSFVTLDMIGSYRYGSELLNVTYDPGRAGELASFAFDDDGVVAERRHLIERGVLVRALGGVVSQARAGVEGVANARASSWNRPPIDRMANLNVEPGDKSFEELVAQVERGLYVRSNRSWSIDDSRNKFQFGCEWGRLIVDGRLGPVVKNPNYRGVSASFWRSLKGVGDEHTFEVMGSPYCGKGEPNQVIRVGHAAPACLFDRVDVFGGEA